MYGPGTIPDRFIAVKKEIGTNLFHFPSDTTVTQISFHKTKTIITFQTFQTLNAKFVVQSEI